MVEDKKISDVYAYTVLDARRRAAHRALEALMKKQPSHVNNRVICFFCLLRNDSLDYYE